MPLHPLNELKILELFWLGDFCFFECKRDKNLTCSSILSPFRTPFAYFFKKKSPKNCEEANNYLFLHIE